MEEFESDRRFRVYVRSEGGRSQQSAFVKGSSRRVAGAGADRGRGVAVNDDAVPGKTRFCVGLMLAHELNREKTCSVA